MGLVLGTDQLFCQQPWPPLRRSKALGGRRIRGDIYLVSLDPTEGREQRGSRPVLVVSPSEFNDAAKLPVILPITTGGDFARRLGFAVPLTGIKT